MIALGRKAASRLLVHSDSVSEVVNNQVETMSNSKGEGSELARLRQQIDTLDLQILRLLNERMLLVEKIAEIKVQAKMDHLDQAREQAILGRLAKENQGPMSWGAVERIFTEILAVSRGLQSQRRDQNKEPSEG